MRIKTHLGGGNYCIYLDVLYYLDSVVPHVTPLDGRTLGGKEQAIVADVLMAQDDVLVLLAQPWTHTSLIHPQCDVTVLRDMHLALLQDLLHMHGHYQWSLLHLDMLGCHIVGP